MNENNIKTRLSKMWGIVLSILGILLVAVVFSGCGWGWFVPYSFQPSYHEFKKMCKLNELPNDEEKYNKILAYFDLSLDTLDWEELNKKTWKVTSEYGYYRQGIFEYATLSEEKEINSRLGIVARFLSNENPINRYNINQMSIGVSWHTRRYLPAGNEGSGFYWSEETLACVDVVKYNYNINKEINNDKQATN